MFSRLALKQVGLNAKTIVICFAAFGLYLNTINADFVYDDLKAILQNDDVTSAEAGAWGKVFSNDFWGTPLRHNGSHKSYRPFCTLTFRLNYILFGLDPGSYHAVNVLLHVVATFLFTVYALRILPDTNAAFLSGLLFAVHPIHVEAVAGVVGRADLLAAIFFLLALLSNEKALPARMQVSKKHKDKNGNEIVCKTKAGGQDEVLGVTVMLAACSMLCKENGLAVLGVILLQDLVRHRLHLKRLSLIAASAVGLLAFRACLMGFSIPKFSRADNPASKSDNVLVRSLTFLYLPVFNALLLLNPNQLSFDWSMEAVPLIKELNDARNLQSLILYGLLVCGAVRSFKSSSSSWPRCSASGYPLVTCIILMTLPFIPATNLFFYVGFVVAERVLYIPSMGFCLLLGHSIVNLAKSRKSLIWFRNTATLVLIIAFSLKTVIRNEDWKNEERLYRSGIRVNPPKALNNLGNVYTQSGRLLLAEQAYLQALHFRPNMADVHYNLGVLLQQQRRFHEALKSYEKAIHFRPKLTLAHLNLALTYSELNQKEKALDMLVSMQSISYDGTKDPKSHQHAQLQGLFNAGKISLEMGRPHQAIAFFRQTLTKGQHFQLSFKPGLLNLMGEAYEALNDTAEAERWYRASLQVKPDHIPAFLTYGNLLAKNKTRHNEAEYFFSKAHEISPGNAYVHLHYGLFLMDQQRNLEAAAHFQKAAEISPNDYESNFNAGVAYRQSGRHILAEKFYKQAVLIRPQDASARMNLGAMLHLVGKLSEAEAEYLEASRLRPGDSVTKVNLQRLHNIMIKKGMTVHQPPN